MSRKESNLKGHDVPVLRDLHDCDSWCVSLYQPSLSLQSMQKAQPLNRVVSRSPLLGRVCFTGGTDLRCFSYQASQPCHRNSCTGWSPASWQSHVDKPLFSLNSTAGPYTEKLFTCVVFSHRKHLKILCVASFLSEPCHGLAWKKRNGHTSPSPPRAWAGSRPQS